MRLAPVLVACVVACNDWESLSSTYSTESGCVAFVVAGDTHTCARMADGSVLCWGDNRFGQLGSGDKEKHARAKVALGGLGAAKVFLPAGDGDISSDLAAFGCAITTDNALSCWGDNRFGQLGVGDTQARVTPARIDSLGAEVSKATNGAGHTCAQTTDGSLYCWGRNSAGQLGTGDAQPRLEPAKIEIPIVVDRLSAGAAFTCARGADGSLSCWGANEHGQLGIGSVAPQNKPTAVTALGTQVVRVSTGAAHTCVFTADGDTNPRSSPVKVDPDGLGAVSQVFAGGSHTCAIRVDGSLWCWGDNRFGQLGTGDTDVRLAPVAVEALGTTVAAAYSGGAHTCAVKVDGSVWCWGSNQYGQLGVDVGPLSKVPVQVMPACH
jgi:alpha-tubulin suppressor-like RCC1 family protein